MPKNQPVRIIDQRRSAATGSGGNVVLPGHTHDDRYVLASSYTAADVLAKLLTVDGSGTGLDADLLDGNQASAFAAAAHNHDHGALTGLADDDHTQYHNDARGDARYSLLAHNHDHGALTGLADDDHTQYALLAGRAGGQTLIGGTGSGDVLILRGSGHATRPQYVVFNPTATRQFYFVNEMIAHPFTAYVPGNVIGDLAQSRTTEGGMNFRGFGSHESTHTSGTLKFTGHRKSESASYPVIEFQAWKSDGGTDRAALSATAMLALFQNGTSDVLRIMGDGLLKLSSGIIAPFANSTTALQLANAAGTAILTIDTTNSRVVLPDGVNVQLGTSTGTKIGISTSAKLGFYGATPIVQPAGLSTANAGAINSGDATTDAVIGNMRTRIGEIETKLKALGLLA